MRVAWVLLLLVSLPAAAAEEPSSVTPGAKGAVGAVQALIRACKYDDAEKLIEAELGKAAPEDRGVLVMAQGMVAEYRGDWPKAIALYRGVKGQPVPAQSLRYLGLALIRHKEFQDGFTALNTYLVNEVKGKQSPLERDVLALAVALAELGRMEEAGTLLDQAAAFMDAYNPLLPRLRDAVTAVRMNQQAAQPGAFWALAYGSEEAAAAMSTDFRTAPLQRTPPPKYPRRALRDGAQGYVLLEVRVDEEGQTESLRVLKAEPKGFSFESAAVDAVKHWRYRPQVRNCRPVKSVGLQRIDFRMAR